MKTKQKPTAAGAAGVSLSARQRSRDEDPTTRLWQRHAAAAQPAQCERERKHEAARREKEAQAQQRRKPTATPTATPTSTSARFSTLAATPKPLSERDRARQHQQQQQQLHSRSSAVAVTAVSAAASGSSESLDETAQLRLQLEHLAQLSEHDFEREFRKWMAQEGVEDKMQAHLRMDLIQSFHNTALGQLLRKASTSASASALTAQQNNCLLLSPMSLALHTLVAEFLHVQNCHYTLSVFCSETPHRHTLPDFEGRREFRFSREEQQQVLQAILGEQQPPVAETVLRLYADQRDSLLLDFFKALVELALASSSPTTPKSGHHAPLSTATQTPATVCLEIRADVDTSRLFQTQADLLVADADADGDGDGRAVYVGSRLSQTLHGVQLQLGQLMRHMRDLCRSCAPPVEIISQPAFEKLLQQELYERQRMQTPLPPGQTAIKLPEQHQEQQEQTQHQQQQEAKTVLSPSGPIQLPAESASVPRLPHLHAEQVASLAMVQQALQQLQQQLQQTPQCMQATLERMEALVVELTGCVQTLSNVLNLAMEQEYAVGRHKGFKLGYREGFAHGHFMGMQEGLQAAEQQQQQRHPLQSTGSQTQLSPTPPPPPAAKQRSVISQTQLTRRRHRGTGMERPACSHAASQTTAELPKEPARSYEQWIYEMLHSESGQVFLERVELSLNKALELQKQRLDELYDIKLRHHAEMLRLSRRQNSWRVSSPNPAEFPLLSLTPLSYLQTLCRHVERDSHSLEARELVHKIFRLLEHYEAHHQLLSEKIQQTEQAAAQAARIQPVWGDDPPMPARPLTPMSTTSSTSGSPRRTAFTSAFVAPSAAPIIRPIVRPAFAVPPGDLYAAAAPAPYYAPVAAPAPALAPVAVGVPAALAVKPRTHHASTNTQFPPNLLPTEPRPQPAPSFNEALLCAKNRMVQLDQESNLLEQSFLGYLERARAQKQKQKHSIRASCARERQQFHRTMDSFRDWQRRMHYEETAQSAVQECLDADLELELQLQLDAETDPESYQFTNAITVARHKLLAELHAPDSLPTPTPLAPASVPQSQPKPVVLEQVQSETQLLLSRVEATLARVTKPPSLQLQMELDADVSTGGGGTTTHTPLERIGDGIASRKLQRSMAKMQQLFGYHEKEQLQQQQQAHKPSVIRPWSAPSSKLPASFLSSIRPHTAPSSLTETLVPRAAAAAAPAAAASNLLGLLDALSDVGDTTANSSSLTSLDHAPRTQRPSASGEVYDHLLGLGSGPGPGPFIPSVSPSATGSSSPTLSHSQDFWKRLNL
ncbi:hypothetical protein KR222_007431 [Zaprionus bogoriensis]|nr:hypothetical protein KR222_007431 [Zaprionus bogoriensis]